MEVLIKSLSGATPDLGAFPVILRDGDLYVTIGRVEDLWVKRRGARRER